jgi:hypothetical protein
LSVSIRVRALCSLVLLVFGGRIPTTGALLDFEVSPADGLLTVAPGSLTGWGYTLTNNSPDLWLVTTSLGADPLLYAQPALLFDFPVLDPGTSVSVPFDPSRSFGLYQVNVSQDAPVGFVEQGIFVLQAEWWNGDPAGSGVPSGIVEEAFTSWRVQIAVVPEPGSVLPLCLALPVLYRFRRKPFTGGDVR